MLELPRRRALALLRSFAPLYRPGRLRHFASRNDDTSGHSSKPTAGASALVPAVVESTVADEVVEAADTFVPALPSRREFDVNASFHKFPFIREVQLGIMRMGVSVPTRVQDLCIPQILGGASTFMLAQTGTGKTLAYVLPLVHKLLESNDAGFFPMSRRPRAIIVQPTRELALQTIKVVRNFPIQSAAACPGMSFIKESQALHRGIDIVVCTPFRLMIHLGKENIFLNQVRHLVIDEADTLCDTFYEKDVGRLVKGLSEDCPVKPQVVLVGAARTHAVTQFLKNHMSDTDVLPVVTTDAHTPPTQVEQIFSPTKGKRRLAVLWDIMNEVPAVGRKTLVFTNRVPTCKALHRGMLEQGVSAVALHGNMHHKKRKQVWDDFTGTAADVMVCTNLASRGLDFSNVHHVIMYDFPLNLADYLHRVGRTARGGKAGRVTTITPRRYWPFVAKIQEACKAGKPIEVRHATKNIRKILKIDSYARVAASARFSQSQKRQWKKRLGLPPARNLGSPETKKIFKRIYRRVAAVKKMRFLQKRGILQKGHGIPKMPDRQVEQSETQTVSTLVRARDGLLQVIPRRRRESKKQDVGETLATLPRGNERRSAPARQRRPVM